MNRNKQQKPCSSCFKGVCWKKQNKKLMAQITTDTGQKHIGLFLSEIDASRAYNTKALELFGEYANLNDISE